MNTVQVQVQCTSTTVKSRVNKYGIRIVIRYSTDSIYYVLVVPLYIL